MPPVIDGFLVGVHQSSKFSVAAMSDLLQDRRFRCFKKPVFFYDTGSPLKPRRNDLSKSVSICLQSSPKRNLLTSKQLSPILVVLFPKLVNHILSNSFEPVFVPKYNAKMVHFWYDLRSVAISGRAFKMAIDNVPGCSPPVQTRK